METVSKLSSASHILTYQPFQNCQNSLFPINVKENRRGNHKLTSQRHWQHWAHKTQNKDKQKAETKTKHNLDKFPNCHTVQKGTCRDQSP